jgi:hypothetical protein
MVVATALGSGVAMAAQSLTAKEDAAQLSADRAALQRQLKRLDADEARLKADTKSGRMSAESKDAMAVYHDQRFIQGEKADIAKDKTGSLQINVDRKALKRQIHKLEMDEARLKADNKSGKMAATSPDAEKIYRDQQAVSGEKKAISADEARLKADQKK